jgi:ParB family chromosome partitioning protein
LDGELKHIPVDLIQRGKYQPRMDMHEEALVELAASIKQQGVMQPIVIRPISSDRYEIIAGERRWRATQLAGLDTIPAVIKAVPDDAAIAMSLIENIQRENLNPIEEAVALKRLQDEFELTQQQGGRRRRQVPHDGDQPAAPHKPKLRCPRDVRTRRP